jgi:hypothetical protein
MLLEFEIRILDCRKLKIINLFFQLKKSGFETFKKNRKALVKSEIENPNHFAGKLPV